MGSFNEVPVTRPMGAIAPAWHTVVVVAVLLGFSLLGALGQNLPGMSATRRIAGYLVIIVLEWGLVAFIGWSTRRRGIRLADLAGDRWTKASDPFRDLGIAIGFLVISEVVLGTLGHLLKAVQTPALRNLFPHGAVQTVLYLFVALTAGFCEELIFRGYLQRQFAALTGAAMGGVVLQGIVFGAAHGYQGWKFMLIIAVFGIMFGLLAQWRKSLRPGMIAHFLQDGVLGLLAQHFTK